MKSLGKSALIVAGLGYGLVRGLGAGERRARLQGLASRLDEVERGLNQLSASIPPPAPPIIDFVTHEELAEAIDRATARISGDLDGKFQAQSRAVNSLRAMISQTDILLQRVLEGIENAESEAQLVERSRR